MKKIKKIERRLTDYIPLFFLIAILFIGIGYASINNIMFDISGSAMTKTQEGVFITNVDINGDVNENVSYYNTLLHSVVILPNEIDTLGNLPSVTYEVTVYNSTNLPIIYQGTIIDDTDEHFYSNPNIEFKVEGISVGDVLETEKTFSITFYYKDNVIIENNILESYIRFLFGNEYDFLCIGKEQEFIVPKSGYYQIETYGAQGGGETGGKGGKSKGVIYLEKNEKLYVYVGCQGGFNETSSNVGGYNGGGYSGTDSTIHSYGGGGATDIRYFGEGELVQGDLLWNSKKGLNSRIMVAGGGGGSISNWKSYDVVAGGGGGLVGGNAASTYSENDAPTGATQTKAGDSLELSYMGSFGQAIQVNTFGYGGGGGSGYYGGSNGYRNAGSGGSSFISGYAGTNAIQTKMNNVRYIKDCINGNSSNTNNHWNELQAIKNGENLAYGKKVTSTGTILIDGGGSYSLDALVDNKIAQSGENVVLNETGLQCVTVDLGREYDLDSIKVWHYWQGTVERSYNNHSLYISSDNNNWTTLIDNRSGVIETEEGIIVSDDRTHTNNTIHSSGKYFIDGEIEQGINSGDGHAKIKYLGNTIEKERKLNNVRYIKDCINENNVNRTNAWNELQAINNGVNVAYGKTVTTTGTLNLSDNANYSLNSLVDSQIIQTGYNLVLNEGGLQCVIVDLGQEYDLDDITVWHYWELDERIYNNHSLYISSNNTDWITLIDDRSDNIESSVGIRYQEKNNYKE